ncbi:hypothetical protein N431DRAFT_82727 [Stipitochalara longipes BDJ]|nr:hypothetical protein N431DRAFT_82727 [Stipitochalara longipes BDJ]
MQLLQPHLAHAHFHPRRPQTDLIVTPSPSFTEHGIPEIRRTAFSSTVRIQTSHCFVFMPEKAKLDHDIAFLLCLCYLLGFSRELEQIIEKLISHLALRIPASKNLHERVPTLEVFDEEYVPFAKCLIDMLKKKNIQVASSPFQQLFRRLLSTYIVDCVGPEPKDFKDWTRETEMYMRALRISPAPRRSISSLPKTKHCGAIYMTKSILKAFTPWNTFE